MSDLVPRDQVSRQGVRGFVAVAGGVGTLFLATLGGIPGIIIGGVITVIGLALSGGKKERTAGVVTAVAGAAVVVSSLPFLSSVFGGLFHGVMYAAGIVLLGVGGFSLYRFFSNLRKRS
jgi:hypothetical protein